MEDEGNFCPIRKNRQDNKGLLWIFKCMEENCLSQSLKGLFFEKDHLNNCYESTAFLRDEQYVQALIISLNAIERNQPNLLSQIDRSLYNENASKNSFKCHRRTSSHPNFSLSVPSSSKIPNLQKRRKTLDVIIRDSFRLKRVKSLNLQLRRWKSMPNIQIDEPEPVIAKPPMPPVQKRKSHHHSTPRKVSMKVPNFDYFDRASLSPNNIQDIKIYEASSQEVSPVAPPAPPVKSRKKSTIAELTDLIGLGINDIRPQEGEKIQRKISTDNSIGIVPRPVYGQSLTSFLQSAYFSRSNIELERENAHFG